MSGGLLGFLSDPAVASAVGKFFRKRPLLTAAVGGFVGAAAYAALTHRPEPAEPPASPRAAGTVILTPWSGMGDAVRPHAPAVRPRREPAPLPPTPAAIAARARAVRVWAFRVGQGASPAEVPIDLVADVDRYVAAGGREPHGNAHGAFPFDW